MQAVYGLAARHKTPAPPPAPAPPVYVKPRLYGADVYPGVTAGAYVRQPLGVILHGSRSGLAISAGDEFYATARYAIDEPNGYGWTATIGPDLVATHFNARGWGWNARGCSSLYLAVEFAQPRLTDPIDDGMVRAFCWWFVNVARVAWPALPRAFPSHAELDGTAAYGGVTDGKTDCHPRGSAQMELLRGRINQQLDALGA